MLTLKSRKSLPMTTTNLRERLHEREKLFLADQRRKQRNQNEFICCLFYLFLYNLAVFNVCCLCSVFFYWCMSIHTNSCRHDTYGRFRLIAGHYYFVINTKLLIICCYKTIMLDAFYVKFIHTSDIVLTWKKIKICFSFLFSLNQCFLKYAPVHINYLTVNINCYEY